MKFHLPSINQFASLLVLSITNAIFQLLLIPILIHNTDNGKLGSYFISLSYSVLLSILVNFGTSQTAVVELRKAETNESFQQVIAETLAIRTLPLVVSIIFTLVVSIFANNGLYFLLVIPILLSEYINPQFYLIATYKVKMFAVYNFLFRVALIAGVYYIRSNKNLIEITILISGLMMLLQNTLYLPAVFLQKGVLQKMPALKKMWSLIKTNSLVVGNGLTVHLQQSLFLFALPSFAKPIFISAYGFVDKLISSFRTLVNAYSSAIMPHATSMHQLGFDKWKKLKQQQNKILSIFCFIVATIMFIFPSELLTILLFGKNNEALFFIETTTLLKMISIVPFLIALNVLNTAELILEKKFISYFIAGLIIMLITILCISIFKLGLPTKYLGYYPMIIEGSCLLIYIFIVNKQRDEK